MELHWPHRVCCFIKSFFIAQVATPAKYAELRAKINQDLQLDVNQGGLSIRRNNLDLKKTTCNKMLNELKHLPYKQVLVPNGGERDKPARLAFCRWVLTKNVDFFRGLIITDEATVR